MKATDKIATAQVDAGDELGLRLRAARARIGMTRKQLAMASGTSERYLAHLEAGTGNPSLTVLIALADALAISLTDLLPSGGESDEARARIMAAVRRLSPEGMTALDAWLTENASSRGAKAGRIALIGLRGAGKSTLGVRLADALGVPFLEMSKAVERAYGGSMGTLIEFGGQAALHRYEAEIWEELTTTNDRIVIALPGGIVANGGLYSRMLESAHSIWLEANPEDHMGRVVQQGDMRPMAANRSAMDDLRAILSARSAEYSRADARFDTSAQDIDASVAALEALARQLIRGA